VDTQDKISSGVMRSAPQPPKPPACATAIAREGGQAPAIGAIKIGTRRFNVSQNAHARLMAEWLVMLSVPDKHIPRELSDQARARTRRGRCQLQPAARGNDAFPPSDRKHPTGAYSTSNNCAASPIGNAADVVMMAAAPHDNSANMSEGGASGAPTNVVIFLSRMSGCTGFGR